MRRLAFYDKLGYVEVLRTEGFTGGVAKCTMQKRLVKDRRSDD